MFAPMLFFMPPNSQLCNSNPPVTHNSPYTLLPAGCGTVTEPCDVECKSRYIFDSGLSRCTLCGNGTVDTGNGELCDKKEDAHCKTDCSNCMRQYHTNASLACVENACGRLPENTRTCNSVLPDDHEQGYQIVGRCDPGAACQAECDGVFVYNGNQGCTICGNNRVDTAMGEVCDFSMPDANCKENCSGCNEYFTGWY